MNRVIRGALLAAVAAALSLPGGAGAGQASDRPVVVSAAVSLTDTLQQLAPVFQMKTGQRVVLNLGASNTLARQITFGAGADVFISADEAQMNAVAAYIDPASRVDLLGNQLAVALPDDRSRILTSIRDLLNPDFRRIAIGDPAAVPAGVYARQYLQSAGLWSDLMPRIVPSGSVRLALAAVESGAADAAIVYHTDIATAAHATEALVIREADGPRIVYPGAIVRAGKNPEGARRFLAFLRTAEAMTVFTRAGFLSPVSSRP